VTLDPWRDQYALLHHDNSQPKWIRGAEVAKLVYCTSPAVQGTRDMLSMAPSTSVIDVGSPLELVTVLTDLAARGIRRLMVEGGQNIHTQFLAAGLADVELGIAPFLVRFENLGRLESSWEEDAQARADGRPGAVTA
jgi:hypothetical protein